MSGPKIGHGTQSPFQPTLIDHTLTYAFGFGLYTKKKLIYSFWDLKSILVLVGLEEIRGSFYI